VSASVEYIRCVCQRLPGQVLRRRGNMAGPTLAQAFHLRQPASINAGQMPDLIEIGTCRAGMTCPVNESYSRYLARRPACNTVLALFDTLGVSCPMGTRSDCIEVQGASDATSELDRVCAGVAGKRVDTRSIGIAGRFNGRF
jgi:hypothetical protein